MAPPSDLNLLSTFSSSQPYSVDQSLINRDMKRLSFAADSVDISDNRLGKGSMCSIFRGMVELDDAELERVAVKVLKGQGDELKAAIAAEMALLGRPGLRGLMQLKGGRRRKRMACVGCDGRVSQRVDESPSLLNF
jgi:hypothetical protein